MRVQPPDAAVTHRPHGLTFSANEVYDLRFDVWILESRSSEPIQVTVFTPSGALFKVLRAGIEASPSRRADRYAARRGLSVLSARMALIGTHVTTRSLYGEWQAEASFVGADSPCSRPLAFVIER